MSTSKLATLGIIVDPTGAIVGTLAVDQALIKTAATSKATTGKMQVHWSSVKKMFLGAAAAVAGIGAGFTAISALSEFAKFEQGMRNVAAVSGSTAEELKQLEQVALDMAIATRYNPQQTTQALYALASAGLAATESMRVLPDLLALAEAGQGDLSQTTELVVSTMAQFNLEADQSTRVVDVLTAAIGASATNIHRLQVGMAAAGPASNALNQSFEDTVAAVSLLTTALGNGEMAGTGIKTILGQLAVEAKEMGIEVFDGGTKMQTLVQTLIDIEEHGVTVQEIWKRLGLRGGPAMSALINLGTDAIEEMIEKIKSSGQAARVSGEQLDTLQGDIDQLGSSADVFQVKFGAMISEDARKLVQWATEQVRELTGNLGAASDELRKFTNRWDLLLGAFMEEGGLVKLMFEGLGYMVRGFGWALKEVYVAVRDFPINLMALVQLTMADFKVMWESFKLVMADFIDKSTMAWNDLDLVLDLVMANIGYAWSNLMKNMKNELADWLLSAADAMEKYGLGMFDDSAASARTLAFKMRDLTDTTKELRSEVKLLKAEHASEQAELVAAIAARASSYGDLEKAFIAEIDAILKTRLAMLKTTDDGVEAIDRVIVKAEELPDVIEEIAETVDEVNTHTLAFAKGAVDNVMGFIEQVMKAMKEAEKEWKLIIDAMNWGEITPLLGKAIEAAFAYGAKGGIDILKKAFSEGSKTSLIAGGITFAADAVSQFKDAPNAAHGLLGVAAMIPIPQVQAVVAAISALDALFDGKLLGTDWVTVKSGIEVALSASGFVGEQWEKERKEKILFLGSSKRFVYSDLEAEMASSLEEAFDNIMNVLVTLSNAFGVEMGDLIVGTFEQEFDKDGKLVKSISNVMGREWAETLEDFTRRLLAENILALVGQTTEMGIGTRTLTDKEILDRAGFVRGLQGAGDRGTARDDVDEAAILAAARESGADILSEMMSEVSIIAERWRYSASLLLEGAEFLMLAQKDIADGLALLSDSSLTEITDLTEDLANSGESLSDAYLRMRADVTNLETALLLTNNVLDITGEEFIRFAVELEQAAGGLEKVTALWESFFSNYFSEHEQAVAQLSFINDEIAGIYETMGRSDLTFANFRAEFEKVMSTLTPEEIANWLKLGDALSRANELIGGPAGLLEAVERYVLGAEAAIDSTFTLATALELTQQYLNEAIAAYNGTAAAQASLTVALNDRYQAELAFLNMIEISVARVQGIIANAIMTIQFDQLTTEAQYNWLKARAEELAASIPTLVDPEEVAAVVEEINRLQAAAWGLLDESQRDAMAAGFISFLEGVGTLAEEQLTKLRDEVEQDQLDNNDKLALILDNFGEKQQASVQTLESAANTFGNSTVVFAEAVGTFAASPVVVHIESRYDTFEAN